MYCVTNIAATVVGPGGELLDDRDLIAHVAGTAELRGPADGEETHRAECAVELVVVLRRLVEGTHALRRGLPGEQLPQRLAQRAAILGVAQRIGREPDGIRDVDGHRVPSHRSIVAPGLGPSAHTVTRRRRS